MTTESSVKDPRVEAADRSESWLYIVRDEPEVGGREFVDDCYLAQEGSSQLRPGERADTAAEALAHCLNCPVAIVEKMFVGDEQVHTSVISIFRPSPSGESDIYAPDRLIV